MNRRDFLKRSALTAGLALTQPWNLVRNGLYAPAPAYAAHPKRIFNGWQHTGMPDFETLYGWRYLLFRHWQTYTGQAALWSDNLSLPAAGWYDILAANYTHPDKMLIFDHEAWPAPTGSSAQDIADRQESAEKFVTLYNGIKAVMPDYKIAFYVYPMNRDFFRARTGPGDPDYIAWQAINDDYAALWAKVDFVVPSIYFFYTRDQGIPGAGENVADAHEYFYENITECRRCTQVHGTNQPIYPYVWNRRQDDATVLDMDVWIDMCRTAYLEADGLVTFGGFSTTWDNDAPWFLNFKAKFPFGDRTIVKPLSAISQPRLPRN